MKKFASMVLVPLCAGFLWAQAEQQTTTTETQTTTTDQNQTWNGTLMDAACQSTHSEHHESTTTDPSTGTTKTESSNSQTVECPVTTTTTSFGLMTSDGKFVRFDDASNTRIIEMVKKNKKWDRHAPTVSVVGKANGEVIVLDTIR
jgi:cytoskeletal protein RodZ